MLSKLPFVFSLFLLTAKAFAVTLSGQVPQEWLAGHSATEKDIFFWKIRAIPQENVKAPPVLVILFSNAGSSEEKTVEVTIEGFSFSPSLVAVPVEQKIIFSNTTEQPFNCLVNGTKTAKLDPFLPGKKQQVTLIEKGWWRITCPPYDYMQLTIFSGDVAYSTWLDDNGFFKFGEVRPGQYTIKVLLGEKLLGERVVNVANQAVFVDFRSEAQDQPPASTAKTVEKQPTTSPPPVQPQVKPVAERPAPEQQPAQKKQEAKPVEKPAPAAKPSVEKEESSEPEIEVEEE